MVKEGSARTMVRTAAVAVFAIVLLLNGWLSYKTIRDFQSFPFEKARSLPGWGIRADMSYEEMRINYGLYHGSNFILYDGFFRPRWSVGKDVKDMTAIVLPGSIDEGDGLASFAEGEGNIDILEWNPEDRTVRVDTPTGGRMLLRTFYYPSWKAYMDGAPIPVGYDPPSGLISISVPEGAYEIDLRFERSVWGKLGAAISALSAVFLLGLLVWGRLRGAKKIVDENNSVSV
jgi:hypothetical protein